MPTTSYDSSTLTMRRKAKLESADYSRRIAAGVVAISPHLGNTGASAFTSIDYGRTQSTTIQPNATAIVDHGCPCNA